MAYPLTMHLQPFFLWLLQASWQAGILVCLILLIQRALGRQMGVRGRYWLWLVVLIRMTMFWTPPSPVSVYNFLPLRQLEGYRAAATPQAGDAGSALAIRDGTRANGGHGKAGPAAFSPQKTGDVTTLASRAGHWVTRWDTVLFLFWLAGACALTGHIIASHIRLWRLVRRESPVTDRRILDLLEDCQRQMGIKRAVGVIATDRIDGPALLGCLRPRLLLPRDAMAELSHQELRHVFLHELAHLRRDDIVIGYLVTLLQVLHWFNPLVALAFKRMRADREMVCDGLAMSALAPDETAAYGHTVIHQIEQLLTPRRQWMLAALSGDKARIKQRIAMISQFRKETFRCSPLAFVLIGLLACTGLTDGIPVYSVPVYGPAKDVPTTHQDKHANIERIVFRHRDTGKYLVVHGQTVTCDSNSPGDAGLWEARFDVGYGQRDQIVYFYSVATCRYLTWDKEGNLAVNGLEPNESARWCMLAHTDGARISPYPFAHFYLRPDGYAGAKVTYGTSPSMGWDTDALWRVKTSDDPPDLAQWHRQHIPGPDWGPPWSTLNRRK